MKHPLTALLAATVFGVALPASAQMTPGTVKLLSGNATLTEASSGDAWIELKDDKSAKFLAIGPEILQADFRFNLGANEAQGTPVTLAILAGGKEVARFKITPRAGTETWKGRADLKPSLNVGFFVQVDAGPHAYEMKTIGATRGAAMTLVPKAKAKRPLPASAQTVQSKPAVVATPAPTAVVAPTPKPLATPINTPVPLESLTQVGPKASELKKARRTYETVFKAGYVAPASQDFSGAPGFGAEARWAFGKSRTIAASIEVLNYGFSALLPDDPDRADAPAAVDVSLLPISVGATYLVPLESNMQPYVTAGATAAYGQSTYRQLDRGSIPEALMGYGGQAAIGVQYDMAGTDLAEGGRKIFLEVKGSYLGVPFEAHEYTDWSSVQVLGGISLKF